MPVWDIAVFSSSINFVLSSPYSFSTFLKLLICCSLFIQYCIFFFIVSLVLDIDYNVLLFAPCSSVFLVAMLAIQGLDNMHVLLLQPCKMSWRELLFNHLGIAKATWLSIRMHNNMFYIWNHENAWLFPIWFQLHLFLL